MPYSSKEIKLMQSLVKQYCPKGYSSGKPCKKASSVYHAMLRSNKYDKIFSKRSKRGK